MLTLKNKKLRFGRFLFILPCLVALGALIGLAQNLIHREVDAITNDGETVHIVRDRKIIRYGLNNGAQTHRYYIYPPTGASALGYCAQPDDQSPTTSEAGDDFTAKKITANNPYSRLDVSKVNMIKYLIYVSTIDDDDNANKIIMDSFFPNEADPDQRYATIHVAIGIEFGACKEGAEDINGNSCGGLDKRNEARGIIAKAQRYIDNEDKSWLIAKDYSLFGIDPSELETGEQNIVWIEYEAPTLGSLTIKKCDASDTSQCLGPQGGSSFAGITFEVRNDSGSAILYNGNRIEDGGLVATGTADDDGTVKFGTANRLTNLPLVKYRVVESGTNDAYNLTASPQTSILSLTNQNPTLYFRNQIMRGDVKFVKKNQNGEVMANIPFKITSAYTGEWHIVVTDSEGRVDTRSLFNLHSNNTNCYDPIRYDFEYDGCGTWFFGRQDDASGGNVDNNLGALPYGQYTIEELECDANKFCSVVNANNSSKQITIDGVFAVVDLGTWENECSEFSIETLATDGVDGDKLITADENAVIKDAISYCLHPNTKFTISGILINQETGEPILVDNKEVRSSVEVEVGEEACGETELVYSFDATGMKDTKIVIFTYVTYGDEIVFSHDDINNKDQTVHLMPKTPDTGLFAKQSSASNGSNSTLSFGIGVAAASIIIYAGTRVYSRRSFMRRSR